MTKPTVSSGRKTDGRSFLRDFLHRRQHPIKILGYTSKTLWLLIIPIVKNLVASDFDLQGWLRTYWLEFITIFIIVGWAVFRWLFVFYRIDGDRITVHSGPFGLIRTTVFFSEITAMRTEQGYIYRAVHAGTMYIETAAVSLTNNELKLVISRKSIDEIYALVSSRSEGKPGFSVAPKKRHMLIFSLLFSSTVSGVILFGAVIFSVYRIVGGELERRIAERVNTRLTEIDEMTLGLSKTVPKAVLLVGLTIAGGWLLSFLSNLRDNWNFCATRRGGQMLVKSGAVKKLRKVLNRSTINYFDLQQTLTMKLARLCSVHILCPGYSKNKKKTAAIIPLTGQAEMAASLRLLAPELSSQETAVTAGKGAVRRFITLPLAYCILPIALKGVAVRLLGRWETEITIFTLALTIPMVWKVIVSVFAARTTAVGLNDTACTLCYCRGFTFHRAVIPRENITGITLLQNPFQKLSGTCTLQIYTNSEKRVPHKIGGMPRRETAEHLAAALGTDRFMQTEKAQS